MRTFLIIWLGQVISIIGSGLTGFALGVWIYQETGRATPFALTVLFSSLPRVLLSPIAGSLADRWNRRMIMILADTGSALVSLGAVFLVFTGRLEIWHVYLIAPLGSVFGAFQAPAYMASITMLVPKKNLARANGLVQTARAMETLVAPLLAGALLSAVGMRGVFAIDFITYFFAIGALLAVDIPQPKLSDEERSGTEKGVIWRDIHFGWRYLADRPGLLGLLFYFALVNFLMNFSAVLSGPLVLSFGTPATLGAIQTASGVGMLLGSVVMSAWGGPERHVNGVVGFIALAAVGGFLMGVRSSAVLIGAGFMLFLFCIPIASGSSQAIFQSKVAPEAQGRVFAARSMISQSIMPLSYLLAGPAADRVFEPLMASGGLLARTWVGRVLGVGPGRGIGLIYVLAALLLLTASAVVWSNPHIRNVEDELGDPAPDSKGPAKDEKVEPEFVAEPSGS
jgi:MFS family permease